MTLDISQIYLVDILESALLDLDIQPTPAEWKIIQDHIAQLEQALKQQAINA